MKNRSRPFECSIAGKTVNISLRHGGGLQEPASVYVRCDERDCQYVDLNTPPCPLRIEMFADGSDRRVADYLWRHAGARACYACLTEAVGITHDQVRRAAWRLKGEPEVVIRPARCSVCHYRRVTIGVKAGSADAAAALPPSSASVPEVTTEPSEAIEVAAFLRRQPGFAFCVHCLARELRSSAPLMREMIWSLEGRPSFTVKTGQCVSCLLSKPVIRFDDQLSDVAAPRRVIEVLLKSPGSALCHTCVAFSTDLALSEVRRVLQLLEPVEEIERLEAECSACGRRQPTVRLRATDATEGQRVDEVGDVLSGSVRHRGYRIDLRSFRTGEGWRAFALVKTPIGALVPDAPAIVLTVVATKLEADELAAATAREWIDKHLR